MGGDRDKRAGGNKSSRRRKYKKTKRQRKTRRRKYKRTKKRKYRKRKQKGGVRFRDIITGENKDQFIGQEIEIIQIDNDIPLRTDLTGWVFINELINKPGFIQRDLEADLHDYRGEVILTVYFPLERTASGDLWGPRTVILFIPKNLRELAYREDNFRHADEPNYYVQLRRRANRLSRLRTEDLFSKERLSRLNTMAQRRNVINPRLYESQTNRRIDTLRGSIDPDKSLYDVASDVFTGKRPSSALYDRVRGIKQKPIDITADTFDLIRSHVR